MRHALSHAAPTDRSRPRTPTNGGLVGAVLIPGRPGALPPALLLSRLRGEGQARPEVDPGLAGGLREWMEDRLGSVFSNLGDDVPQVRVTKQALNEVLLCEAHAISADRPSRKITHELARGVLVDALFRVWVTTAQLEDPWEASLAAVAATGDEEIAAFVERLPEPSRRRLAEEVGEHALTITSTWPVPNSSWLARTQESIEVPLVGGRVVLAAVVDLVLGAPSSGQASVCLVEVKSGARRLEHRADLHYYALLETLRSGASPFRVATYYSLTGELDAEQVAEDVLIGTLQRVVAGAERLCRLASGAAPERRPNPLCAWCRELPGCGPGRERVGSATPRSPIDAWVDEAPEGLALSRWDQEPEL
jgi:hypothetical protein